MLWIIGSMALVLFGILLMSVLIVGGRADRMESTKLIEPSTGLPFTAEDKIRIVLQGFQNQIPVSDLCKREGISPALYYSWVNHFIDGGEAGLSGEASIAPRRAGLRNF